MSLLLLLFIDSIGLQCSCSHSYNSTGTALPLPPFPDAATADRRDRYYRAHLERSCPPRPNLQPRVLACVAVTSTAARSMLIIPTRPTAIIKRPQTMPFHFLPPSTFSSIQTETWRSSACALMSASKSAPRRVQCPSSSIFHPKRSKSSASTNMPLLPTLLPSPAIPTQ